MRVEEQRNEGDLEQQGQDPATEETIANVASASVEDCIAAVDAAQAALKAWSATSPRARGEMSSG